MRKSLFVSLALVASLCLGMFAHADDNYDLTFKVQTIKAVTDNLTLPPMLPSNEVVTVPATTAAYAKPVHSVWVDRPRTFRDFRTIADSGPYGLTNYT